MPKSVPTPESVGKSPVPAAPPAADTSAAPDAPKPAPSHAPKEKPRAAADPKEIGGPKGPDPTRYGDWEQKGRCTDF
jgi:hypothetical protein